LTKGQRRKEAELTEKKALASKTASVETNWAGKESPMTKFPNIVDTVKTICKFRADKTNIEHVTSALDKQEVATSQVAETAR